jgi:hypothetical protein
MREIVSHLTCGTEAIRRSQPIRGFNIMDAKDN